MTPLLTISEIDELVTHASRRFTEVAQFVKDWNRDPSRRSLMISEAPSRGSIEHRTAMAAITRCLCARDRVPVPRWAESYGPADEAYSLNGESLEGSMGEFIRYRTPAIAAGLRIYFDRSLLETL